MRSSEALFVRDPHNPVLTPRRLALRGQRRHERRRHHVARRDGARLPRRGSTRHLAPLARALGRRHDGLAHRRDADSRSLRGPSGGGLGRRGRTRHARRRARLLGCRLHGVRSRRPGHLVREDDRLRVVRAARRGDGAGEQERRAVPAHDQRRLRALPPPRLLLRRRLGRLDLALVGHDQLDAAGADASRPRGRMVGLRAARRGRAAARDDAGWLVVYHGVRNTVAGALYRMGAALLDLDEPDDRAPPLRGVAARPELRTTSERATCPAWSSRAGSCTTSSTIGCGSTTAPRTRRSPSPARASPT